MTDPARDEGVRRYGLVGVTTMHDGLKTCGMIEQREGNYVLHTSFASLLAERDELREALKSLAERPNGYHDCSDYERGYGDAWAAKASMAWAALKNITSTALKVRHE